MANPKDVSFWTAELEQAARHERKWRKRAAKVIKIYRDDQDTTDVRFNILWSNTQTQRPALYSSTPKPVVRRRHKQAGEVGRTVSMLLERALTYSLDPGGAYDFDRVGEKLILDYLLPGRMVARVKYHPVITERTEFEETDDPDAEDVTVDDDGKFLLATKYEELVDEEVRIYHVPWNQYRQAIANVWDDVWWVAYGNNFLSQDEIIDQFGSEHADVPLTHIAHFEEKDGVASEKGKRTVRKAQVWEIWDREDRKVYAVVEGYDKFLMAGIDDPLKLRAFYPSPEPILIVETPDSIIPIPEYTMYQYQAEELNRVTMRIDNLVDAMKLSGLYPGSQKNLIEQLLNSKENTLIPVEDWGAITERGGLQGMIEWLPLRDIADAWQKLTIQRDHLIQAIFELTGISDIQRGQTDPRETKGAQQLKASFGSRRLLPKQQDTQRYFRDLFRLQAEIISEHFQTETIAKMAQMPMSKEIEAAREVMRDDALRSFSIDIETDSTIAADEQAEKQGVAEFTTAMGSFLGQTLPIIQANPAAAAPLGKMMLWMSRKFKISRDVEEEIEDFLQTLQPKKEQGPSPEQQAQQAEQQKQQAEMQAKAQQAQAALQIKKAESDADTARKDAEAQAKIERENALAQLQRQKLALDIEAAKQKLLLDREEAEARVVLSAVDQRQKSLQEASKPEKSSDSGSSKIQVNVGETTAKKITLLRDKDDKISGAEVTPITETAN